jgi:hypothetical protein
VGLEHQNRRRLFLTTLEGDARIRQAMLAMIVGPGYVDPESGKTVFSYAHPIFWAPFSLIGDGGGVRPQS